MVYYNQVRTSMLTIDWQPLRTERQISLAANKHSAPGGQWRSGKSPASNARSLGFDFQARTDDCTKFSDCPILSDESINRDTV